MTFCLTKCFALHVILTLANIMGTNSVDYSFFVDLTNNYYNTYECEQVNQCFCYEFHKQSVVDCNNNKLKIIPEGLERANVYEFGSNFFDTTNEDFRLSWKKFLNTFADGISCLYLQSNPLMGIPDWFLTDALTADRELHLDLSRCKISALTDNAFSQLHKLKILSLWKNPIVFLPVGIFRNQVLLSDLDLNQCDLTEIHEDIFTPLTKLIILSMARNPIRVLPVGLFRNQAWLYSLDLELCDLTQLHKDIFASLTNLNLLYLENNKIEFLPADIFRNQNDLISLNLASNQLTSLPFGLFANTLVLKTLDVSNNPFICGCGMLGLRPLVLTFDVNTTTFVFEKCKVAGDSTRTVSVNELDYFKCYETTQGIGIILVKNNGATTSLPQETQHLDAGTQSTFLKNQVSVTLNENTSDGAYITTGISDNNDGVLAGDLRKSTLRSVDGHKPSLSNLTSNVYTNEGLIATGTMMTAGIVAGSVSVYTLIKLIFNN